MIDNNTIPAEQYSFKDFLFKNRRNRITLILAAVAIVIQFGVFKYFYPFASFIHGDSFNYLQTAYWNLDINNYMVGYARFLRIFSVFTRWDTALVAYQYLFMVTSALYFVFTLIYFYKPSKIMQVLLFCFIALNPLFLYLANLISSDGLFLSLSMTWITLLIWIMHRPTIKLLIWHGVVLFIAFTVRYNAMIYPPIAGLVFLLSHFSLRKIIAGIAFGVIPIALFVLYTGNKYKALTGTWQYSPFGGWQLSNNAMYAYRYVDKSARKPVPLKFRALDNMIREYFDSTRDIRKHPQENKMASTVYMWDPRMPLFKYRELQFKKDSTASDLKRWASIAPLYAAYGIFLMKQYPWHYIRYYLWPNANKYYAPPIEFLESFNSGKDSVPPVAQRWFNYASPKLKTHTQSLDIHTLDFYPILSGLMNVVFLMGFISFTILNGLKQNILWRKLVLLASFVWVLNAGFAIFSTSAALRFQAFPILTMCIFALLLVDYIAKEALKKPITNLII
jgi:hypothetical protein